MLAYHDQFVSYQIVAVKSAFVNLERISTIRFKLYTQLIQQRYLYSESIYEKRPEFCTLASIINSLEVTVLHWTEGTICSYGCWHCDVTSFIQGVPKKLVMNYEPDS